VAGAANGSLQAVAFGVGDASDEVGRFAPRRRRTAPEAARRARRRQARTESPHRTAAPGQGSAGTSCTPRWMICAGCRVSHVPWRPPLQIRTCARTWMVTNWSSCWQAARTLGPSVPGLSFSLLGFAPRQSPQSWTEGAEGRRHRSAVVAAPLRW